MSGKSFQFRLLQKEWKQRSRGWLFVFALSLILGLAEAEDVGKEEDVWEAHKERLKKHPQKLDLNETAIGQVAKEGRFEDFFQELQALKDQTPEERLEILQAKDSKGNSLFHFMVTASKKRIEFAGAMLYLTGVLAFHGDYDTLDDWNQAQLTPLELAKKIDNPIAMEYLLLAENQTKKLRIESESYQESAEEKLGGQRDIEKNLKTNIANNVLLGGLVFMYGYMFLSIGVNTGSLGEILFGLPQLLFGGGACYQAFKSWQALKGKKQ